MDTKEKTFLRYNLVYYFDFYCIYPCSIIIIIDTLAVQVWICSEIKHFWNKIEQENKINAFTSWKLIHMKFIKKGLFYKIDELSQYFTVCTMVCAMLYYNLLQLTKSMHFNVFMVSSAKRRDLYYYYINFVRCIALRNEKFRWSSLMIQIIILGSNIFANHSRLDSVNY